ncbi:MAG: hypothetical protein WBA96_05490 [Chitinophagaceae bacterium]|nr:hypothetical protein [Chitinophagaceae bacterium]MBK8301381.1 hypothetical protein [Chitinophagaceae bacterium]MBK9658292.1 hypothetical protein [Chitinophagaceae bacterium]
MGEIINRLAQKPRTLFLVDGIGAFITAFLLLAILRTFNEYVGMPRMALTSLSIIAAVFCLYSISCYFLLNDNWQPFLKAISVANLLYCCLTSGLVIYYYNSLTILGVIYFLAEIIIIVVLVYVELKVLNRLKNISGVS